MNRQARWLLIATTAAGLVIIAILALQPDAILVNTAEVRRGTLTVTVSEQGRTRARLPYVLHAPVAGELQRINRLPGDHVSAGEVLARISVSPENPRNRAAIDANLAASRARVIAAQAKLGDAESAIERARREAQRREQLFDQGLIGEEERDQFVRQRDAARSRLLEARAGLSAAQADVAMARALQLGNDDGEGATLSLTAPAEGTIYQVHERNTRVIQAGSPILSLSNADALELEIDLLTRDAVRVRAGDTVQISDWGGEQELTGRVRHIEPEAFTRISALGVEEQRVNVIADLDSTPPTLGAGYRVEATIIVERRDDVLLAPDNALFQRHGDWQVFVAEAGRAQLRTVQTATRGSGEVEITQGLRAGDRVIRYPSDQLEDGVTVEPQKES